MKMDRNTPAGRKAYNDYMREYMRKRSRRLKSEAEHERGRKRFWTPEALEWLHHAFPNQNTKKLALAMGRPYISVASMASKLKIRKSDEFYRSECSGRLQREDHRGRLHQFPKGHVPANKGLRRPGYAPGRMKETQFKKGTMPWNTRFPLQSERVNTDGYLDRKISMTCKGATAWIGVHRLVWMQAHGDVPPGHVIVFKDRNKLNTALGNLECISLRENMARNTVHNLPRPLAEIVQLRGALVRQINRRSGHREKQDRGSSKPPIRNSRGTEGQGKADGSGSRKGDRGRRASHRAIREGRG